MCREYIIDVIDYTTILVSREFLECFEKKHGVYLNAREFANGYVVDLEDMPPSIREEYIDAIFERARKVREEVSQLAEKLEKLRKQQQQRQKVEKVVVEIKVVWDLDGLFGGPRRVASFSLPEDLIKEIDEAARRLRMSKSELVTKALSSFIAALKRYEDKLPRA